MVDRLLTLGPTRGGQVPWATTLDDHRDGFDPERVAETEATPQGVG
jgi:hypothetical protein